jgi:uncharacterized protein
LSDSNKELSPLTRSSLERVKSILEQYSSCTVAYSGGVDSTLLLAIAREIFDDKCLAVIVSSPLHCRKEHEEGLQWLKEEKIRYEVIEADPLDLPEVHFNHKKRCYFCKRSLFSKILETSRVNGIDIVVEGSNYSDNLNYRPGKKAIEELGVISPLNEGQMTKAQIREAAALIYHLPQAEKPSGACFATRFPYGTEITSEKIQHISEMENFLIHKGYRQFRVRYHQSLIRLELPLDEMSDFLADNEVRSEFITIAKDRGISFVTIDLEGFRSGCFDVKLPT